jgi:hypothetical protein
MKPRAELILLSARDGIWNPRLIVHGQLNEWRMLRVVQYLLVRNLIGRTGDRVLSSVQVAAVPGT